MPDPKLLWFRSTEGHSLSIDGQNFIPDHEGYIAVPENLGPNVNAHPSFEYFGLHKPEPPQTARAKKNDGGHPPTPSTASYPDLKAAVQKRGNATESELLRAVREALPGKKVPREWVRRARNELFGKPGRKGRPKSPK